MTLQRETWGRGRGKVHTRAIPNAKTTTLLPIINQMILPDSIVYTDALPICNALDISSFHYMRVNLSSTFVDHHNHINGTENFWDQAKRHLCRFNGIRKETFPLYLKECE